ncbi:SSS sodium solute transporter superfamily [Luminiphilus syltensis NOR5-1B]|uniref:SSS sodium solute transporter superfamily n=1 Tax=Luminiphilus syltensis NOR5-1B TaxID=565045 RepID=B8KUX5_9GAMM|nr:sodium:solute symporter [Luminiphilus syltensis]EED36680.1 SSS sodium solute transporter superfamily [Luminiphilus syltensis NOR5-1B]
MTESLSTLDWWVIGVYLVGLIGFAVWLSRSQFSREDYYVGGRHVGAWPVALSIMATQCSTNSILGAPAFVAFAAGGGLIWLQYELAVPLAMLFLILLVMPMFRHLQLVSVYGYLEQRFDLKTRLTLSALFLFVRAFATAVTVYSIALVIDLITGVGFFWSVVLLGAFTVVYDVFGGIRGVIYSDVIQLLILVVVLAAILGSLIGDSGGLMAMLDAVPDERRQTLDFAHHGLGDGETFAFWPMLIGGFFLYVSYYGCDQSQVQRTLSTASIDETNKALFLNGLLRFPLVLLYCLVGVGIAVFAVQETSFIDSLPTVDGTPEYNLAVPLYMINALPSGVVGLAIVALFAAAMSSLDSVINSLSATTMEDFVRRFHRGHWDDRKELLLSRLLTVTWGTITLIMAFYVGDIATTVLEAINKIGSLANGPILAVFLLGFFTRRVGGTAAVMGLVTGVLVNGWLWRFQPDISWLWWNPLGFAVTWGAACAVTVVSRSAPSAALDTSEIDVQRYLREEASINWYWRSGWLLLWFAALALLLLWIGM